jgi:hypothetical protein
MSGSFHTEIETKVASDHDGSYKAQLIQKFEGHRDEFAYAKLGMLPPDEYDVMDKMERVVSAAITFIEGIEPGTNQTATAETDQESFAANNYMFSI